MSFIEITSGDNMLTYKTCPKCQIEKPAADFAKSTNRPDGLQYQCKACEKEAHAYKYMERGETLVINIPAQKKCNKCKETKPSSSFSRHNKRSDGLQNFCKTCKVSHQREKYQEPGGLDYHKKYYKNHLEITKPRRDAERAAEPWRKIVTNARHRSMRDGIPFDIDIEWGRSTYTGVCELSGLKFVVNSGNFGHRAYSPSIDRRDPNKGYTKDNCRWILMCLNAFKGSDDDATIMKVAISLVSVYSAEQFRLQQERSNDQS